MKMKPIKIRRNVMSKNKYGTCALCKQENVELRQSHIIPKGVFKRAKTVSNSRFRNYYEPKQIYQDGIKIRMLCNDCEEFFSKYERAFDNRFLDVYLANPKKHLPKITNDIYFYIISVSWRIIYDDLYNYQSFHEDSERDVMLEFEQKLWRFIIEKYKESKPDKELPMKELPIPDLRDKPFGVQIAEAEKYFNHKKPEDMSEIQNYVFTLYELYNSDDISSFFDSMIIGYSFYERTHTKYYIISLYKGLIIVTLFSRKRNMLLSDKCNLIRCSSKSRNQIKKDIKDEVDNLLGIMASRYEETQKKLDENGLREKIAERYKNNTNKK